MRRIKDPWVKTSPWRCPRQAVRVKTSWRRPSCLKKKNNKKKQKTQLLLDELQVVGNSHKRERQDQVACTLHSPSLHHCYPFPGLSLICSEDFTSYRKLCVFYRRIL